jgi:hypothetical protein
MCSGKIVLKMKEILWKNNFKIVKDVFMIYVNFIAIGTIVSEKIGGNCFLTDLRMQFFRE